MPSFDGEAVSESSSKADRLDGGNVLTKSKPNTDGGGSFLSVSPKLLRLGEKERGGVEAPDVRRRRIRNLFTSAFLWALLNAKTAIDASEITVASGNSHSFDRRIEKLILTIHQLTLEGLKGEGREKPPTREQAAKGST